MSAIGPASPKQEAFLNDDSDIVLFGGAAGSGKSYLGVMAMLKWATRPDMKDFRGVIVRRTMVQVTGPGGVAETAQELYSEFGAKFKSKECKFIFPQGATVVCKGCEQEKDKHNFQGWQVSTFLVDEAQQFEESQVVYFISRMRTAAPMKPQMLMTANPDYSSFLRKWLEDAGYLDERGLPRKDRDGKRMWFIRQGNTMRWAETREELEERYGKECGPMSFTFYPATCHDNPVLLERDPSYVFRLKNMPRVEMERLYLGSWYAKEQSASVFDRNWLEQVEWPQQKPCQRVRCWDLASSKKSEKNHNPDYTASTLMSRTKDGEYIIEHVFRFRGVHGDVQEQILKLARQDGPDVVVGIPWDPGPGGEAYAKHLVKVLSENGFTAKMVRSAGRGTKMNRFGPFASVSQAGMVKIVKRCCDDLENNILANNDTFFDELEEYDGSRNVKDDMLDAISDTYEVLRKNVYIPNFLPGMTGFGFEQVKNPLTSIR